MSATIRITVEGPEGSGKSWLVRRFLVPALNRAELSFTVVEAGEEVIRYSRPQSKGPAVHVEVCNVD